MENILSDYSFDLHDLIKKMEYFLKSGNSENNVSIIYKIFDIYKRINENDREEFILYLPLIFSNF